MYIASKSRITSLIKLSDRIYIYINYIEQPAFDFYATEIINFDLENHYIEIF